MKEFEGSKMGMKGSNRGLDYTPLFHFLISKVGKPWAEVHSEAVSRLDGKDVNSRRVDPIRCMVAEHEHEKCDSFRYGESSQWSGLFVDDDGILQKVNPALTINDFEATCTCCTHTFNGIKITRQNTNR